MTDWLNVNISQIRQALQLAAADADTSMNVVLIAAFQSADQDKLQKRITLLKDRIAVIKKGGAAKARAKRKKK